LQRQYLIFVAVAAAGFAALIVVGLYFNPLKSEGKTGTKNDGVVDAKIGQSVHVRYSASTVGLIQKLPAKSAIKLESASELQNTNLGGLKGELRYTDMIIEYVQNGKKETISEKDFDTIQYKFLPDAGNKTTYRYENVDFTSYATSSELVATFVPLSTAKVGQQYTVKLFLDSGTVQYAPQEKIIRIVG
jgi:hypothetical protein